MPTLVDLTGGEQLPRAVQASFDADMAVVRGLIPEDVAERFANRLAGQKRKTASPVALRGAARAIPNLREARRVVTQSARERLGVSLRLPPGYNLKADLLRRGGIKSHIDNRLIVAAVSVNLCNGSSPTVFAAERIAPVDASHEEIVDNFTVGLRPELTTELEIGDAVIVTRGVQHMVEADDPRVAMLFSTRTLTLP